MCVFLCYQYCCSITHAHLSFRADIRTSTTGFIFVAAIIVIVFAVIRLIFEIFQFIQLLPTLDYVKELVNWIEVILFVCAILFAFVFFTQCNCPMEWQWQVGVVAVFLAWIDLIIFLRKIPLTGTPLRLREGAARLGFAPPYIIHVAW